MTSYTATDGVWTGIIAAESNRFERILAANGPSLARLAASYTDNTGDRDDLLQEIAMALWQALPRFREECSERTFVFRIAHNRAIAHLAKKRSIPLRLDEIDVPDPSPGPEHGLVREQQGQRLMQAIRRLPIPLRQVVTLTLEGVDYAETAAILGISENNVGVRMSRARDLLRKLLGERK
jgi:RNA polymerase sigma-70 factor (ECF subfamily)